MGSQVFGYTVTRQIPEKVLQQVLSGEYKVYGGTIHNSAGRIVAHLINTGDPLGANEPAEFDIGSMNSYSIHRIGAGVRQLGAVVAKLPNRLGTTGEAVAPAGPIIEAISENASAIPAATANLLALSTGTMLLSGLTLAVSSAGFAFLNKKLNRIDQKLSGLQKEVKEIKDFLNTQQRAQLTTALNTLRDVGDAPSDETRRHLLVHSRQTLGTLHHHYRSQFLEAPTTGATSAAEEYFSITAIAHALCAAELDMLETAARDVDDSYACWLRRCREFAREKLLRAEPQRFLGRRYASNVRSDELIDWLEFAHDDAQGLGWIDSLRRMPPQGELDQNELDAGRTPGN